MTIRQVLLAGKSAPPLFIGGASAASDSVSLPSHETNDLILIFAVSTFIIPSLASGFANIGTASISGIAGRVGWKAASSGADTSGTWTNASSICAAVYRRVGNIGDKSIVASNATTLSYNGLTISEVNSVIVGVCAAEAAATISAPSGMTNRFNQAAGSYDMAFHDTEIAVPSWSTVTGSLGGTYTAFGGSIELIGL